ncbi:HAD domain-containing protein [uncultured Zoogloea sp.]|uniref:HAD domain-containing protein n=1 Tax=uncultured Zoogloea sp. TaxID=160237 RepID=UPI00260C0938|nr:HAD domain-containing protein [uncultured Zoogloea sp.]
MTENLHSPGVIPVYVFLDFDGVTHPWREAEDFRCLPVLEAVLRDYPETRVVIASDWRTLFSLPKLRARFSPDIQPRVIDTTPAIFPRSPNELYGLREREARQWLAAKAPTASWLAIDDAPGNWPTRARLVLTDFKQGFTEEDAGRMRRLLDAFRAGQFDAETATPA